MTDNDDDMLFRNLMRTVKPLKPSEKVAPYKKPIKIPSKRHHALSDEPFQRPSMHFSPWREENQASVKTNTILSYCSHAIPKKRLLQLKKGEIACDARLDLHGLSLDVACETLVYFIEAQVELGHRCVLVVHGKGSHHGETPVLKNQVNHLLQQVPSVLAFHSAPDRQGGTGALYVLLKRRR